jgi:SecD/SecF fusion protein
MRERRKHLLLVALIAAALVGVALIAVPKSPFHRGATLGLDLQGGLEVVLKAVPPKGHKLTSDDLDRSVDIMRNRIDKLGVSEPELRKQGSDQIVIQLAGVTDPQKAAALIGKTAQLELYDLEQDLTGPSIGAQGPVATPRLHNLLSPVQSQAKTRASEYYLFDKKGRLLEGPAPTKEKLFTREHPRVPKGGEVLGVPTDMVVVSCTASTEVDQGFPKRPCPGSTTPGATSYYLFKHQPDNAEDPVPEMTGGDIKSSGTKADYDQLGQPIVRMSFTGKGGGKFQDITRRLWQRGNLRGSPQHFAIVLDREIKSFPQIDPSDRTLSNGISGGAQIENIGDVREAKDLALVLQTGALPVSFKQIERTDVSATLGKDSLQEAKTAALIGLLLVAIFLLILYRLLGVVAVAGLAIYSAFMYAAILIFNVTLTLPGFAGLILTIGVAADANVVIFERIKEEIRAGKSPRAAIATGYQKGFHTIVDANVVTAITALVLFAVATAQVKGFALMLLIGTVVSLVTAVAATRAMLGLLADFRWFNNPSFMGAAPQQRGRWLQIDFIGRKRTWFAIASTVVAACILAIGIKGLNLGIDFKGGTQIAFKTQQFTPIEDVRAQARGIGHANAVIQGRGSSSGDSYKSFQIRTESMTLGEQNRFQNALQEDLKATSVGIKNVSSSFSHQIARLAILAILVSLGLIVIYISLRFDFKYAVPVLVALAHDIIVTVGVYAITGREVTTATVAAVLTVLGYSIYDTIIIFDRIRENVPLMRRASFATIANISLWETIRRSLATTFITLLPIGSLLLFGGATLKDFAFALLVGITSGAYSSIFVAAPLLAVFKEREPEFRRRKDSEVIETGVGGAGAVDAEPVADAAEEPEAAPVGAAPAAAPAPVAGDGREAVGSRPSKREQRRQRRRSRPHGRAR